MTIELDFTELEDPCFTLWNSVHQNFGISELWTLQLQIDMTCSKIVFNDVLAVSERFSNFACWNWNLKFVVCILCGGWCVDVCLWWCVWLVVLFCWWCWCSVWCVFVFMWWLVCWCVFVVVCVWLVVFVWVVVVCLWCCLCFVDDVVFDVVSMCCAVGAVCSVIYTICFLTAVSNMPNFDAG